MEQICESERGVTGTQLKRITKCRVCGTETIPYFGYGNLPLVNKLFDDRESAIRAERYPLDLNRCPNCLNSQLSVVVDPRILYSDYPYRSSVSKPFRDHCRLLAEDISRVSGVSNGSAVIDIAGNDGAMLREMMSIEPGIRPFVVDPSEDALSCAPDLGTICDFWGVDAAERFLDDHGKAKVITAQNVVAHVNDLDYFFEGVKIALMDRGVFVVEVPHVIDMIRDSAFDTVYHEHLSYMSIKALDHIARKHDLYMFHADKVPIHCGTIRAWFSPTPAGPGAEILALHEERELTDQAYSRFALDVKSKIAIAREKILNSPGRVIGVAASAKGNILLNMLGDTQIDYIVDDTPAKIGKFAPGVGLEIKRLSHDNVRAADFAIILARNFESELTRRLREEGFTGEIYCP